MILILVGIYSGFKHNFRNNGWLFMIGIGGFFLADRFIPGLSLGNFFWPIAIIAIGIIFILRPSRRFHGDSSYKTYKNTGSWQAYSSNKATDNNDLLFVESVFSGVQRTILSKNFQGGKVTCVFGGAEIDLTQADITGSVLLKVEAVFGGIKLIVPPHWQVVTEIDGVFHGVNDKRGAPSGAYNDINKTLVLKGDAVFGGIEIRSYGF
jgi:predicted membrane protein